MIPEAIRKIPNDFVKRYGPLIAPIRPVLSEINRRNEVLATAGWFHFGLFVITILLSLFDTRLITGVNAWLKPMKFMVSITIYLWTIAWYTGYLQKGNWAVHLISWGASTSMIIESVCILGQAVRGTTSHYNFETQFDATVFAVMGVMILINSLLLFLLLILFFSKSIRHERVYLWGIRYGIFIFLLGNLTGILMVLNLAHTVGMSDGGPGLPFLNWSTAAGDLRIAHLLGLHALQIFPMVGFLITRRNRYAPFRRQITYLAIFMIIYTGLFILALWQALSGRPFIGM